MNEITRGNTGSSKSGDKREADENKKQGARKAAEGVTIAQSARRSADSFAKEFAKPDKYTGNRKLFDSASAKKMAKDKAFANGTVKDPYTGKKLERTIADAKRKYGDKWQEHLAEADHIVPIKKEFDSIKENTLLDSWLKGSDVNDILNDESNLQTVSRAFNNPKRESTNKEFVTDENRLNKAGLELSEDSKKRAIETGKKAEKNIKFNEKKTVVKNVAKKGHEAGVNAARSAAVTTAIFSSFSNIKSVADKEKDVGEAVAEVAVDTGKAAATAYGFGAAEAVIIHTLKNSPSKFLKTISKSNVIGTVVSVAMSTGKSLKQYVNDEISINEFADAIAVEGVAIVGAAIGEVVLGPIGSAIGAMVASAACDALISLKQKMAQSEKEYTNALRRMSNIENEALNEIRHQKEHLEEIINREFGGWDESFERGFSMMLQSAKDNDFGGFSDGLDSVMSVFKSEAMFHSETEVEEFLFDESLEFDF